MNTNNKRITKNTIFLYLRMIVTMCVSLYTSRVIIKVLGISDYGLFNVVAGVISMFAFVNTAMSGCTQRFLNISLGKGNLKDMKRTFSVALTIHIFLAITFCILLYFAGDLFLLKSLNIEPGRFAAAHSIFILSLCAFAVSFVTVPFDALIIAHEKMSFYAYLSILDVSMKLLIVYALMIFTNVDSVVLYTFFYLCTNILLLIVYFLYCSRRFKECSIHIAYDSKLTKEMGRFIGWSLFGNLAYMLSTHGINIMFNLFFGTVINAAWGIAKQVNAILAKFTTSFQVAASPQIMKYYAEDNIEGMYILTKGTSKYTAFLVLIIGIPLFFEIDYLLSIWIVEYPSEASFFIRIMLLQSFMSAIEYPTTRVMQAVGVLKPSCVFVTIVEIFNIFITYLILYFSKNVYIAMSFQLVQNFVTFPFMLYLLEKYVSLNIREYFSEVILVVFKISIVPILVSFLITMFLDQSFLRLLVITLVNSILFLTFVYNWGIDQDTRFLVKNKIIEFKSRIL